MSVTGVPFRKIIIFAIGFFVFSFSAVAQNPASQLNAKFEQSFEKRTVKVGHTFQGTLILWPTSMRPERFYQLEGKELGQALYVAKVFNTKVSENNADAVKVMGLFAILEEFNLQNKVAFKVDDQRVVLKLPSFRAEKLKKEQVKGQKMNYIDQNVSLAQTYLPWAVVALILIFIAQFVFRRVISKKQEEKRLKQLKLKWENKFKDAKSREEYEEIYQNRDEWLELVDVKSPPMLYFFEAVYQLQFKKNWAEEDLLRVQENFDQIRYIFSDGNT